MMMEYDQNADITAETPLVENMVLPQEFTSRSHDLDRMAKQPLLGPRTEFPNPTFAFARKDVSGRTRPQAIAHRGYKAKFPENTMGAFKGAVEVGADAIETDIHLSKDGVVVLSHDANLKRCFGREEKIIDCDWEFLSTLKTLKEPQESMPRLSELLEYLAQPGLEDIWVLLDIKLDNDHEDVMRLIASTIRSVRPAPNRPWSSRIILGVWAIGYLPLCSQYLPGFPITHIGFSIVYASRFLPYENVSFNLHQAALMTPWGRLFNRTARNRQRPVFVWTVNEKKRMQWDLKHGLDGVITDDPKLFIEVRRGWHDGMKAHVGLLVWLDVVRVNIFAFFMLSLYALLGQHKGLTRRNKERGDR